MWADGIPLTVDHKIGAPISSAAAWISCARIGAPASSSTVVTISSTGVGHRRTRRGTSRAVADPASGYARRYGSVPEACPPVTENLASSPKCGKPEVTTTKLSLLYESGILKLRGRGIGSLEGSSECGASTVRGGMDALLFSWPDGVPARLSGMPLSRQAIFGKKKVLVARMNSGQKRKGPEKVALGALVGTVTDFGRNNATVRLVRVP